VARHRSGTPKRSADAAGEKRRADMVFSFQGGDSFQGTIVSLSSPGPGAWPAAADRQDRDRRRMTPCAWDGTNHVTGLLVLALIDPSRN